MSHVYYTKSTATRSSFENRPVRGACNLVITCSRWYCSTLWSDHSVHSIYPDQNSKRLFDSLGKFGLTVERARVHRMPSGRFAAVGALLSHRVP